jgi:hypothetical protein
MRRLLQIFTIIAGKWQHLTPGKRLSLVGPMDALYRTGVNGFLDFIFRAAAGVDHLGKSQTLIEFEDLRAQLFASDAGDAFLFHYIGEAFGHVLFFFS